MQPALLVKQLRSEFAGPFELNLGRGACAAITVPSGSGKSLFLRMIADIDPNEGKIWLNGRERASMPAPEWRKQATYVSAESGWWADMVIAHFPANTKSEIAALSARLGVRGTVEREGSGLRVTVRLVDAVSKATVDVGALAAGKAGTLVSVICNHCPYVVHIRRELVAATHEALDRGLAAVAINSNDAATYPQDGPDAMARLAKL